MVRPLRRLRGHEDVFEDDLLKLYRSKRRRLAEAAGFALIDIRSASGAEVLADVIESGRHDHWVWSLSSDCEAFTSSERLGRLLIERVSGPLEADRITAIEALGCLNLAGGVPVMMRALEAPFWSQQEAVVRAFGEFNELPPDAIAAVEKASKNHWSLNVRQAAQRTLAVLRGQAEKQVGKTVFRLGFHRTSIRHGLPMCHDETRSDGKYSLPGGKPFHVQWTTAKVHDIPKGFPLKLKEMRGRKGYGTNTFLRQVGGWLYSTDLWHYDGVFGFVSDDGRIQTFAPESAHAAFIIETQFGITALGDDVFGGGDGGVLAVLTLDTGGKWHWETALETPSETFAYAFTPDGILLVRDPFGAVAITKEKLILPLQCN